MITAQKAREIALNDNTGYAKVVSGAIRKAAVQGLTTLTILGATLGVPSLADQAKLQTEFEALGYGVTLNKAGDVLTNMVITWTTPVSFTSGYTGSVGVGYTGSIGATGYTGSVGETGATGYTGSIGETGYTGSAGS